MKAKSSPTIKAAVLQEFKMLPDKFRGLFKNEYKKRIEDKILNLEANWQHENNILKGVNLASTREYAEVWVKRADIQKQIDLLKSLIND